MSHVVVCAAAHLCVPLNSERASSLPHWKQKRNRPSQPLRLTASACKAGHTREVKARVAWRRCQACQVRPATPQHAP